MKKTEKKSTAKKLAAILLAIILVVSLAACAAKSNDSYAPAPSENYLSVTKYDSGYGAYDEFSYDIAMGRDYVDGEYYSYALTEEAYDVASNMSAPQAMPGEASAGGGITATQMTAASSNLSSEKIIYSGFAAIETEEYDTAMKTLSSMITQYGAFIESSNEYGGTPSYNYYGEVSYSLRSASFTIRIPSENFAAFCDAMPLIGNVFNRSSNAENVTEQYSDYESRLKTLHVEEERLLAMLEKCETVEDMITIESKLSDVRYRIESITSSLKNLSNRVNFSSLSLSLNEVRKYTYVPPVDLTYGQQIVEGLKKTLRNVGEFFADLFKNIVIALPVLAILAVLAIAVILILRRAVKKRRIKRNEKISNVERERDTGSEGSDNA